MAHELTERQIIAAKIHAERRLRSRITPLAANADHFMFHMGPDTTRGEHQIVARVGLVPEIGRPMVVKFIAARAKESEGQDRHEVNGYFEKSLRQEINAAIFRELKFPVLVHHVVNIGPGRLHASLSEDLTRGGNRIVEAHSCDFSKFTNGQKIEKEYQHFVKIMNSLNERRMLSYDTHVELGDAETAFRKTFYVAYNPRRPKIGRLVMADVDHVYFTLSSKDHPIFGKIWESFLPLIEETIKIHLDEPRTSPRFNPP